MFLFIHLKIERVVRLDRKFNGSFRGRDSKNKFK